MRRLLGLLLLAVCLSGARAADAHAFAPSLLRVVEGADQGLNVVWKTPTEQGPGNVPLRPEWPEACDPVRESPPQTEGTATVTASRLQCRDLGEDGLVGETLGLSGLDANQASALVVVELRDGSTHQQVLNSDQPAWVVPAQASAMGVALDYAALGIEHIWGGIDHLLFVFGLLLLVGGGRRLLWTTTAFTVGHSVTLSLVVLGLIRYPVALVEFTIALSIFVLAVELARGETDNALRRHPWWLAGGFGLLHGMGFAGALAETGLPEGNVPLALLFFNVGIEAGQIAFLLACLGLWALVRRPVARWRPRLMAVPVYALGALSAMWCIERGLETLS